MEETPKNTAPGAPAPKPEKPPSPSASAGKPAALPVKPSSQTNRTLARALRWSLILLIVFGSGVVLALFAWYQPTTRMLNAANQRIANIESQANQQITDLQAEASTLPELQTQNQELKDELAQTRLHVTILSARSDVAAAQLALVQEDPAKARLALSKTDATLKDLEALLQSEQAELAADMRNRLELAVSGIGNNPNAAESDLNVLATDLLELENAYFAKP